ncbi:MAG: type II toxin-antitoxin system RelE/ParE family toxin [Chloroflexi bacterium]|nr:type II toxin-antitoxin system RelE/ParE family toxin [Chloroflexota bacterium]
MSARRFRVVIATRFGKDFRRLHPEVQERVLDALASLEQDPYRGERVVAKETGTWRLRVGDWRIRYDIEGDEVHILRVRHRREVYRED